MKLYRDSPIASMAMRDDKELRAALRNAVSHEKVTEVIETGTYLGLGSTTMLAESFVPGPPPKMFLTIEANWNSWRQARKNVARFPFVEPLWGITVPVKKTREQIAHDPFLLNHEKYPDVFIDDVENPVGFYLKELEGGLGGAATGRSRIRYLIDRMISYRGDDLLSTCLKRLSSSCPLIMLDSAGGIGFSEFTIVMEQMGGRHFILALDDTHHVKHFRSLEKICADPRFSTLYRNDTHGSVVAEFKPG